jgi:TolB protein
MMRELKIRRMREGREMRFKGVFWARAASLLLLAAALLCAAATPRGEARRANPLARAQPSLLQGARAAAHDPELGRIAFAAAGEIYLVGADGSGLVQLTHSAPGVYNFQPAISPDGLRVAFASRASGDSGIKVVGIDGVELQTLTDNPFLSYSEPAWSPDGSQIAFVRGFDPTAEGVANHTTCGFEILIVNVNDGRVTNLTQGASGTDPSWSPDGTQIAFASDRDGSNGFDIYSMAPDGTNVKQLTTDAGNEAEPAWSPDGKRIAYTGNLVKAFLLCGFAHTGLAPDPVVVSPDIYVMESDGTESSRVTFTENNIEPAWSPDGMSLAFISTRDGQTQVYVMHTLDERATNITSDAAYKTSPSWGRWIIVR